MASWRRPCMPKGCLHVCPPPHLLSLLASILGSLSLHSCQPGVSNLPTTEPEASAHLQRGQERGPPQRSLPEGACSPGPLYPIEPPAPACDLRLVCSYQGQAGGKGLAGDPRQGVLRCITGSMNPAEPPSPVGSQAASFPNEIFLASLPTLSSERNHADAKTQGPPFPPKPLMVKHYQVRQEDRLAEVRGF